MQAMFVHFSNVLNIGLQALLVHFNNKKCYSTTLAISIKRVSKSTYRLGTKLNNNVVKDTIIIVLNQNY
jgi:hypothetical protein